MAANLVKTALGETPADLVLKNGRLINVNTAEVEEGVGVAVKDGRVALVGDADQCIGEGTKVFDVSGEFLVPGLLDAHIHVESSMVTLTQFARAVIPHGTTGVFIDPHEIANVLGLRGVRLLSDEAKMLPLKVFVEVPSCVPSAPGMETSGAELGPEEVSEALKLEKVVALGEVMNFPAVLAGDEGTRRKIGAARAVGKMVEGHAPGLSGKELAAYISAGVVSDHESSGGAEALEKLRRGMKLEIREGSAAKNLSSIMKKIIKEGLDTRHCLLATDDRNPRDLLKEGHIDHAVRRAIEEGADPVEAIQMATTNTAEHFGFRELGDISPGKIADIITVRDIRKFKVNRVFINGRLMAERGRMLVQLQKHAYPGFAKKTVRVRKKLLPSDFVVRASGLEKARARVISVRDGDIVTGHDVLEMEVRGGEVLPDSSRDVARAAVVERHRRTGNVGLGFVRGFGLRKGALASSVGHDAHNLIVLGLDVEDMAAAIEEITKSGGGQAAVFRGKAIAKVDLPIAGLMSEKSVEDVSGELEKLHVAARRLGVRLKSPFMTMAFIPLAVIPKLKLTDKGLIDVERFESVDLLVDEK